MGALLQLMALPATCMAFTWARRCGAAAVALALCRMVATIAVRDTARARLAAAGVPTVARKAVKVARAARTKSARPFGRARSLRHPWKGSESVGFA